MFARTNATRPNNQTNRQILQSDLPAGTERGWLQQRRQAHYVLKEQIAVTVQEAIGIVSLSSLRHTTPLPQEDRGNGARCLAQLQKILCKPDLQWKDVPDAVVENLGKARYGEKALVTLTKLPKRLIGPLPVKKFEQDREQALIHLRQILHRDDITHLNVASLVSEALGKARYTVYS